MPALLFLFMESTIIGIPGMDFFVVRSIKNDIEFGAKIYDFITGLLEIVGTEVKCFDTRKKHVQLFLYKEQNNGKMPCRYFEVSNEIGEFIEIEFRSTFIKEIEKYGLRNQLKGKDVLFQLNNGQLSATEFADKLK